MLRLLVNHAQPRLREAVASCYPLVFDVVGHETPANHTRIQDFLAYLTADLQAARAPANANASATRAGAGAGAGAGSSAAINAEVRMSVQVDAHRPPRPAFPCTPLCLSDCVRICPVRATAVCVWLRFRRAIQ